MPIASQDSLPGESPGQKLARIVRSYAGCSMSFRADDLGALVARGVDDPNVVIHVTTNCGMFALGVMAQAGVNSPILDRKYVTGMAIAWLREIGLKLGALLQYTGPHGPQPKLGALLRYNTAGKNDDHVEWMLSDIDAGGHAEHGGGGRTNNAITVCAADAPNNAGLVTWNYGRPLVEFWDPDKLGIEIVPADSECIS